LSAHAQFLCGDFGDFISLPESSIETIDSTSLVGIKTDLFLDALIIAILSLKVDTTEPARLLLIYVIITLLDFPTVEIGALRSLFLVENSIADCSYLITRA